LYVAPPAGPSGEFPAQTTISRPVQATALPPPPRIPLGERAMLRHLRASGLYAAPSERRSGPPRTLLVTPPHTISCRLVHTTLASRRPAIGAFGSARQEGRGLKVARAGLPAAAPAVVV